MPPKPKTQSSEQRPQARITQQYERATQPSHVSSHDYDRYYYKASVPHSLLDVPAKPRRHAHLQETVQEDEDEPRLVRYSTQQPTDFDRVAEMSECLPHGSVSNTFADARREWREPTGDAVAFHRELSTAASADRETELLKEEERRVSEQQAEPGVVSR